MILIYLKLFDINKYSDFKKWKLSKEDIEEILKLKDPLDEDRYIKWIQNDLDFIFDNELTDELKEKYGWVSNYWFFDTDINSRKRILKHHFDILDSFNI